MRHTYPAEFDTLLGLLHVSFVAIVLIMRVFIGNWYDCCAVWRAVSVQGYYTNGLENVFCVSDYLCTFPTYSALSALKLLVGWQEGNLASKKVRFTTPRDSDMALNVSGRGAVLSTKSTDLSHEVARDMDASSLLLMHSHWGPYCHPRVSTCDSSSPEVNGRCAVVPSELVKPPVSRAAWTLPPTRVWKATEQEIDVALQGLVGSGHDLLGIIWW